ncbi:MAG: glycosyltransferase, partial [Candidatus Nanoarchaeia archaeon]
LFKYTKQNKKYSNCIVFFGKMNYQPNIDAVLWFVKNVLPKLNKELKVHIVGAHPSEKIKNLEKKYKNIIVTGFVKDPYEIIKSSLCVVAPMQTGGGIQNKILESMALGTINIMSSLAAKPIGARHKKEIIIADDPKKMAYFINDIFKNPKKYEYLKDNSKKFIANNFTWSIYEKNIIKIIKEVVQNNFLPEQ